VTRWLAQLAAPTVLLAALLVLWEAYVRIAGVPSSLLPAPSRIMDATVQSADLLRWHATQTILEAVLGFGLAVITAVVFATIIEFSRLARAAVLPLLIASQTVPIVALAPLLVLWFGYGALPKILVVALVCFFPMVIALVHGFAATEVELVRLYRSFGATRLQIFRHVRVPTSLPIFFAGMRIAVTYSVIGAVFAEYVGAVRGLGIFLQTAKNSYRTDLVFSMVAVTAALSLLLYGAVLVIERLTIPWAGNAVGAPVANESTPGE
jgi:ABC-type nitrate/sulfonate/bicarbonate transport system permease component